MAVKACPYGSSISGPILPGLPVNVAHKTADDYVTMTDDASSM